MHKYQFYFSWKQWLCLLLSFSLSRSYDSNNPQDNRSPYSSSDTLLSPGSAFPFSNDFPSARVLHSLDSTNDYLFVFGGYTSNGTMLGDMNLFHIPSERWSGPIVRRECCNDLGKEIDTIGVERSTSNITYLKIGFEGDFPLPRVDHASCAIHDVVYIHGGETDLNNIGLMQDLYEFNPLTLRWRSIDDVSSLTGGIPSRRAGHILVADPTNSRCLLFGGRQVSRGSDSVIGLSDLWELNINMFQWKKLDISNANTLANNQQAPLGRHHAAAAIMASQYFCIFGGSDPRSGLLFRDIWLFDLNVAAWKQLYPVTTGNVPMPVFEFAPPPLEHAHMIPIRQESNEQDIPYEGFLVYGGIGSGGGCITFECNNRQVALGQVYFYSFDEQTWMRPFFDINRDVPTAQTSAHWLYARLHDHFFNKRFKEYAYERITILPGRNRFYEFGGMQANANAVRRNNQQADILGVNEQGKAIAPPLRSPLQEVGGPIPATFSDTLTGEYLQTAVLAPTNAFWNIAIALFNGSIFEDNLNGTILFHRTLRIHTIAPRDLVMIHSYDPQQ